MNLPLLDPHLLAQDAPEALVGKLSSGHSTCMRFNHRGDYLGSGRADGVVIIFDLETSGVARKLSGHTRQVQSLSWSANDRYLLSASQDWKCVLWDLKDGSRVRTVRMEAPVFIGELHPRNHLLFVAALFEDQPMLVDMTDEIPQKRTLPSAPWRSQIERDNATEKQAAQDAKQTTTVTVFSPTGDYILSGTSKGWLNVIDTKTCDIRFSTRLSNNLLIFIRLTGSGREMVVNSSDRIIRTVRLPDFTDPKLDFNHMTLEVEHKFQDVVNRLSWNHVCFSSTGEYVTASTYMNHDIYVWERGRGSLSKILEAKEEIAVVEWHPHRPFVAAGGIESGKIYLWSIVAPQRWSALAPDFAEVEENVEYVEREDEFDIQPLEEIHKRRLDLEDEDVDVLTIEPGKAVFEPAEFQMPVLLDMGGSDSEEEEVMVGAGQYRRKSPGAGKDWMNGKEGSGDERRPLTNGTQRTASASKRRRAE
ncbi:WD40 repeat-like protein [Saccharata proteae CBS 121410]|uniref:WD40 repeat-like protein n=1 Tax=Saccharata proteae CBS 121410 TaxID=1314787 RepID=A0A9P4M1G9_9PEZI|nr:WD40 repeat-like protein [Saccharata proteae CBS 121410]